MQNFRTFQLSVTFYQSALALKLPRHLKDQMLRASSSISLNLAEGYGKSSLNDQRKFFVIAMGSLRECQAIIILAQLCDSSANQLLDNLARHLYCLIRKMR